MRELKKINNLMQKFYFEKILKIFSFRLQTFFGAKTNCLFGVFIKNPFLDPKAGKKNFFTA